MFNLYQLFLDEINRDYLSRTKTKRVNPNVVLTRKERRILQKCR